MSGTVIWDFDGTLAESGTGHGVTADALPKGLRSGFPWHRHEEPHPELHAVGRPSGVWTVGDSEAADVAGAPAAGIPALLVRADDARGLVWAAERILRSTGSRTD